MYEYEGYWLKKNTLLNNKYLILDVIDEGGMGIVYLGYDRVLRQEVSIKEFFPKRFATRMGGARNITIYKGRSAQLFSHGLEKFVNEARILAHFESLDCIVTVKDFFYENQTAYIVMERIKGENVKQFVESRGPMEPEDVLAIMKPILCSVAEVHKEGLLHRDISPDNIIVTTDGKGVLIDFGAARFSEMQDSKTMTVFFKRGYSAEEQYMEKSPKGAYTDVYGACATMYFMLTGIRPDESVKRLLRDRVVPLWQFKDIRMERYREQAIMKGMAVEARKRYSTMDELCFALYSDRKYAKRVRHCGATCILVAGAIAVMTQYTFSKKETVKVEKAVSAQVTPAATTGKKNDTQDSETTGQVVEMCNVVGIERKEAVRRLRNLNIKKLEIKIRWKTSSQKNKGKVISQKIPGKKVLNTNQKYTQLLTVGKGPKRKRKAESTAKPTPKPTKRPDNRNEFDGRLPW